MNVLINPELNMEEYKRDLITSAAFDRERGYLYVMEKLADEYRSVVHVWKIEAQ